VIDTFCNLLCRRLALALSLGASLLLVAVAPGIFSLPYTLPLAWQIPNENVMMARS
jgi:hypothetical protein